MDSSCLFSQELLLFSTSNSPEYGWYKQKKATIPSCSKCSASSGIPLASPRSMSFRTGEVDGEMGKRGEGGVIHKAEHSSSRRNVSFKKRGQQSGKSLLGRKWKKGGGSAELERQLFLNVSTVGGIREEEKPWGLLMWTRRHAGLLLGQG